MIDTILYIFIITFFYQTINLTVSPILIGVKFGAYQLGRRFILSGTGFQKVGFTVEFDSFNLNFSKSKP